VPIDAHCHTGSFEPLFRGEHDIDDLVAAWDAAGIRHGIISNVIRGQMTLANDSALESIIKYPGRVHAYIYLDPGDLQAALRELDRCAETRAFSGVKLHPSEDAWFPYLDHYAPLFQRIEALHLPVLMHSGTYPHSGPLACAAAAWKFQQIPFILAHFGLADYSWECFPAAQIAPNVHVDTTANPMVRVLSEWLDQFGAERMLWGSDFPFYDVSYEAAKLDALTCSPAERELIAGGNAERIFGI
jgi:predicted TIM-barrel fold metal-dependent hydrolase